ncbi:cytochrome b [Falsiroseomonas sp. HW251]|uniref:cytochrome b n=1 Tax=Falsiroseomonas sp. HW251 TaxID=3390998 RepID=UPI003D313BCA
MDQGEFAAPIRGQDALHPDGQYSALSKLFHWVTAPLLPLALATGFVIGHIKDSDKMPFYALHESTGVVIFTLAVLRLSWRLMSPPPALPGHISPGQRRAAAAVHHALYACLIVQPILGFVATNAFGFPLQGETAFLGFIDFPKFMETQESLGNATMKVHEVVGLLLAILLPLHVAGAVFHHAVRRDGTLLRML